VYVRITVILAIATLVFQENFVSTRFYFNLPAALALLATSPWLTQANAQISPAAAASNVTPVASADAAPLLYRSAFEGYQRYTDEKTVNWKEANDATGRIGGWRVYAKESREPDAQTGTPDARAKPVPGALPAKPGQEKP
jgi:hypothetical protein